MEKEDKQVLSELRKQIFLTAHRHGTTHMASAFSTLEILYTLYSKDVLKIDRNNPKWEKRDRLILSKGHAAIGMYAVMCQEGILMKEELDTFLEPGTRLAGEPCKRDLEWVEASTGSLGHGLSMGIGMALAQKMDKLDARTYVILGDGECQEGVIWEAAMSAAAYQVDNLIAIMDCNQVQKMCTTEETMKVVDWRSKWEDFGWQVTEVDGHDVDAIKTELLLENEKGKPRLVLAHTTKGKGVSIMENDAKWHYKEPRPKELRIIAEELGITEEELS